MTLKSKEVVNNLSAEAKLSGAYVRAVGG